MSICVLGLNIFTEPVVMPSNTKAVCLITEHILSHNNFKVRLRVLNQSSYSGLLQKSTTSITFCFAIFTLPLFTTVVESQYIQQVF